MFDCQNGCVHSYLQHLFKYYLFTLTQSCHICPRPELSLDYQKIKILGDKKGKEMYKTKANSVFNVHLLM